MERSEITWLLDQHHLTAEGLERARQYAMRENASVACALIALGLISEDLWLKALRLHTPYPVISEDALKEIPAALIKILSPTTAQMTTALPIAIYGRRLEIAMLDPNDETSREQIRKETELEVSPLLSSARPLFSALAYYYKIKIPETPVSESKERITSPEVVPLEKKVEEKAPEAPIVTAAKVGQKTTEEAAEPSIGIPAEVPERSITPILKHEGLVGLSTLGEARKLIQQVNRKEEIASAAIHFLRQFYHKGAIFVVQEELVIGWEGFGGSFEIGALQRIKLALDTPSIFQRVAETGNRYIGPIFHSEVNNSFSKSLQDFPPQKVALFPLKLHENLFGMVYLEISSVEEERFAEAEVPTLCEAITAGFERLVKEAARAKAA